ncbi:MAG: hypothetical protein M3445_03735 [Actinomycetota bacterium]|nr:hypothetical protein [Actinomycetota bacterium]
MPSVTVPSARVARWAHNFAARHGDTMYAVREGALTGVAEDGSRFVARLPFGTAYAGEAEPTAFAIAVSEAVPRLWGVLLVRKGGFAVARLSGRTIVESKVGQRHVQGRTKAGGQSQQRFARRRDNQARQAYEAAADHAARILRGEGAHPAVIVTGGDHSAVEEVLADPRLRGLEVVAPWLAVADPRRGVLDQAIADAQAAVVEVTNA